ncbi:MAG: hypothetical protein GY711_28430 [bacterium]|nr:hypothetical protein [bacterium]
MISTRTLAAVSAALFLTVGCEGVDFSSKDDSRTREAGAKREKDKPRRTAGAPSWEQTGGTQQPADTTVYRDEFGVRFAEEPVRLAPGATHELTVLLDGPEEYETTAFTVYSLDRGVIDVPAGAVSFNPGERKAQLSLIAGNVSAGEARIVFEKIDFARPQKFEYTVSVGDSVLSVDAARRGAGSAFFQDEADGFVRFDEER